MRGFIYKMVDRCVAVVGAFFFCQLPAFMQQYVNILAGHLEECKRYKLQLDQNAGMSHKSLSDYIQKFLSQQDPDFVQQGVMMQGIESRYTELLNAAQHLQEASIWQKPFVFIAEMNRELAAETYSHYVPSLSFSLESVTYGLIGIVIAVGLLRLIVYAFRGLFPKSKKA